MPYPSRIAWLVAACLGFAGAAHAQPAPADSRVALPVDVTPHVSFGGDDASGVGAALAVRLAPRWSIELDVEARLSNASDIKRTTVNALVDFSPWGRVQPFLVFGGGLETYRGAHQIPTVGSFGWTGSGFAAGGGFGVRVPVSERWTLRTDIRFSAGVSEGVPDTVRVFQGLAYGLGPR
jgi:opacity protein-like surface antigen